jgi:NAD(P)-dependent dehydrogenase (short-subunit alcohol dehydrogenase family)
MKIRESVAFVTGANRGIGLAFAQELLAGGARKVYAAARDPKSVTLEGVHPVRLDVTNAETISAAASKYTDVNLLINNAGIALWTGFLAPNSLEAARAEMETNYFGPLLLGRAFAPILAKNGGGAIVNILSIVSWGGSAFRRNVQRFESRRLGFDQLATDGPARARNPGGGCARRPGGHRYGEGPHPSKGEARGCRSANAQRARSWSR